MTIQVVDPQNILVDGRYMNSLGKVLLNHPERVEDLQTALDEYVARIAEERQGLIQQLASALSKLPQLEQENAMLRSQVNLQISEDWDGLLADLISPSADAPKLYEQCYRAATTDLMCNAAFTVFISTLTSVRIPAALQDAIARLQGALEATNNPISEESQIWLNERLKERKMGFQI